MAEIKLKRIDVTVFSFEPPKILVRWILEPTVLPLQNYTFKIERSEASHDGYTVIQSVPGIVIDYMDMTAELHNVQKRYYYRVTAVNNKTAEARRRGEFIFPELFP